jgi:hypothetical protein
MSDFPNRREGGADVVIVGGGSARLRPGEPSQRGSKPLRPCWRRAGPTGWMATPRVRATEALSGSHAESPTQ